MPPSDIPSPAARPAAPNAAPLQVWERGWLSSNNVLLLPQPGDDLPEAATLIDTGHVRHAGQTLALLEAALAAAGGVPLGRLVNTHLHSDHCGGNAALSAAHPCPTWVPPGLKARVEAWDLDALGYAAVGQQCPRYTADVELDPARPLRAGGRSWQVLPTPGHDPDAVMLWDADSGVLISGDALWGNGFGVLFPALVGRDAAERRAAAAVAFDEQQAALDLIARCAPKQVIPGHGAPFTDVADALQRAQTRLDGFRAAPERHAWHALKVLIKYHLMEVGQQSAQAWRDWAEGTPLVAALAWAVPAEARGAGPERPGDAAEAGLAALLRIHQARRLDDGSVADA